MKFRTIKTKSSLSAPLVLTALLPGNIAYVTDGQGQLSVAEQINVGGKPLTIQNATHNVSFAAPAPVDTLVGREYDLSQVKTVDFVVDENSVTVQNVLNKLFSDEPSESEGHSGSVSAIDRPAVDRLIKLMESAPEEALGGTYAVTDLLTTQSTLMDEEVENDIRRMNLEQDEEKLTTEKVTDTIQVAAASAAELRKLGMRPAFYQLRHQAGTNVNEVNMDEEIISA